MYETTQEQKNKYLSQMRSTRSTVSNVIPKINSILVAYGKEFYRKTKGEYTDSYIHAVRAKAEEDIRILIRDKFTEIIDSLTKGKEDYIDLCFEKKTTTDPVELNFVGKELELMDSQELREFYELHFLDKNMVRLFDIEVKRRSKSNEQGMSSQATMLHGFRNEFSINDMVIKRYDQCIKEFTGARSVSSTTLFLPQYDEYDNMSTRSITLSEMFNYIHAKSSMGVPKETEINILDLAK